jgi:hypothetical protein
MSAKRAYGHIQPSGPAPRRCADLILYDRAMGNESGVEKARISPETFNLRCRWWFATPPRTAVISSVQRHPRSAAHGFGNRWIGRAQRSELYEGPTGSGRRSRPAEAACASGTRAPVLNGPTNEGEWGIPETPALAEAERRVRECEARIADQVEFLRALHNEGYTEAAARALAVLKLFQEQLREARTHLEEELRNITPG